MALSPIFPSFKREIKILKMKNRGGTEESFVKLWVDIHVTRRSCFENLATIRKC